MTKTKLNHYAGFIQYIIADNATITRAFYVGANNKNEAIGKGVELAKTQYDYFGSAFCDVVEIDPKFLDA